MAENLLLWPTYENNIQPEQHWERDSPRHNPTWLRIPPMLVLGARVPYWDMPAGRNCPMARFKTRPDGSRLHPRSRGAIRDAFDPQGSWIVHLDEAWWMTPN